MLSKGRGDWRRRRTDHHARRKHRMCRKPANVRRDVLNCDLCGCDPAVNATARSMQQHSRLAARLCAFEVFAQVDIEFPRESIIRRSMRDPISEALQCLEGDR